MANYATNAGAGGTTFQSDTEASVTADIPGVKLFVGAAGSAQRLLPGQQTSANSLGVTLASDTTSAKSAQPSSGQFHGVQQPKDSGRNQTNYFMAAPVATTTTEALQSLTGYKGGAAVTATTTPAVVTTGKTYRVQSITITYVATTTTLGSVRVNLRANTAGVVAVTSPLVASWTVGEAISAEVAGQAVTVVIPIPGGMEFAAGTGIGITAQGFVGTTATASGSCQVNLTGYEY